MEQLPVYNVKISKKSLIFTLAIVLLAITLVYFSFSSLLDRKVNELENKYTQNTLPVFKETTDTENPVQSVYTLKEFNGKIGVFKDGDFQYQVDIYMFSLPETDKKLLQQGIIASTEQELNDIISSYY